MKDVKFKVGDKVVFCKSSLDSGMIDSDESCSYKVIAVDDEYPWVKIHQNGWPVMYHPSHFEHYVEKEKEMEKKLAKVGDKIRIVAAEFANGCYKNGDVLEVVAAEQYCGGVEVLIADDKHFHVYHTEYEIVEDNQEDDFVFTEEHVGMEVFCLLRGKGVISEVRKYYDDDYCPVEVEFGYTTDRYTSKGKIYDDHKTRVLFFSEPKIEAERFPPKKKFLPTLKEGDVIAYRQRGTSFIQVGTVEYEDEDSVAIEEDEVASMRKCAFEFYKIGEEIKFQ